MRWVWIALLACACSSNNGTSSDGGGTSDGGGNQDMHPPNGPLDDAEQQLERAFCKYQSRCGEIGASEESQCESDAIAALETFRVSHYSSWIDYGLFDTAIAAGRETFDPQVALTCANAVANAPCGTVLDVAQTCLKAFIGIVIEGGACGAPGDCANGYCITDGTSCSGTCHAMVATGARCDGWQGACAGTDYCSPSTKLCTALAASGATCEWLGQTATCASGLFCDAFMKVCKPIGASGATCHFDWECQSGLRCSPQLTCVVPVAEGGSCQQSTDCAIGSTCVGFAPASGGMPAIAGVCRAAPGNAGDPCAAGSCSASLYCDTTARPPICRAVVPAGGACPVPVACADGTICVASACAAFLDVGSPCDSTRSVTACPLDMRCDSSTNKCVTVGTPGASCAGGCRRLLYCDPQSMTCTAQLASGAACVPPGVNGDDPCVDGTCDSTMNVCVAPAC